MRGGWIGIAGWILGGWMGIAGAEEVHWRAASPTPSAVNQSPAPAIHAELGAPEGSAGAVVPAPLTLAPAAYSGLTATKDVEKVPPPQAPAGSAIAPMPALVPPDLRPFPPVGPGLPPSPPPLGPWPETCGDGECALGECCPGDEAGAGFDLGAGVHILRPAITNNTGLTVVTNNRITGSTAYNVETFNDGFSASPSLWLGYTLDCGLTARLTWFRYSDSSQALNATAAPGAPVYIVTSSGFVHSALGLTGSTVSASNCVTLDTIDLDLGHSFSLGGFALSAGAGIRFLRLDQNYGASSDIGLRESDGNTFTGAGPTLYVEAKRPFGDCGLSVYLNSRAGLLFGSRRLNSVQTGLVTFDPSSSNEDSDQLIGTAEIGFGVEWTRQCGCWRPFVRVGFEGRGYFGTGNSQSGANTNVFGIGGTLPDHTDHTGELGLFGVVLEAGLLF